MHKEQHDEFKRVRDMVTKHRDHIRRIVDSSPPLADEQQARLAFLLTDQEWAGPPEFVPPERPAVAAAPRLDPNRRTALYRFYDEQDRLLYCGIAYDAEVRAAQHALGQPWWPLVVRRQDEWCDTRGEAQQAERTAIQAERPLFNVAHAGARFRLPDEELT